MFKHHNVLGLCLTLAVLFLFSQAANAQGVSPTIVACEGIGPLVGCTPDNPQGFPANPFVIVKLDDFGGDDPLFTITAAVNGNMFGYTAIDLIMDQLVTANDLDGAGFRLINLVTAPPGTTIAPIEPGDIEFLGDWTGVPSSIPFVTGDEPSPAPQILEWTNLAGADPLADAIIRINLPIVPEPSTALLLGLGLGCIGILGRRVVLAGNP